MNQRMKCYRTWRLCRRQQQREKVFRVIVLLVISSWIFLRLRRVKSFAHSDDSKCSNSSLVIFEHGECFFNRRVCYPGFDGQQCEIPLKNETYRSHCPFDVRRTEWTRSLYDLTKRKCSTLKSAQREWNVSCLFLCFYHRLTGIIQVPAIFWQRSLANELNYWKTNPMIIDDRLFEHVQGFNGYRIIPLNIPSIVEIGAGPFTQTQYLLSPSRSIQQIILIEPNALSYMELNNCAYRGGHLRGHPVQIIAKSIETVMAQRREDRIRSKHLPYYSVLISMNVVEHVNDALEYFRGLYDLLADHGLLIFHERWYDHPRQGDCVLDNAEMLHPIRITKWVIDVFLDQFEPLYVNFNRTKRQIQSPCNEHGIYFIGRKKKAIINK